MQIIRLSLLSFLFSSFISNCFATIYPYTRGNQLDLLEDVHQSASKKIELVQNAKHHIHIITFYWDDTPFVQKLSEELIKAHQRGVEVRILTTYLPSLLTDFNGDSRNKLIDHSDEHEDFSFISLKTFDNLILTNNLHEKIFLVDAQVVILGGRNISDSQFNGMDMEVIFKGEVVNQVQDHFQKTMNFVVDIFLEDQCKNTQSRRCKKTSNKYVPGLFLRASNYFPKQPFYTEDVEARILSHNVLIEQWKNDYKESEDRILIRDDIIEAMVDTPFERIRGYNYFIVPTPRYKEFLIQSLADGKKIEIMTNSKGSASAVSDKAYIYALRPMIELADLGLEIIEWHGLAPEYYLHAKVMIFDEDEAIVGSHNFGIGSTSVSNEIAIQFHSLRVVSELVQIFESDKNDPSITKKVDPPFLRHMLEENSFMSFLLNLSPIKKTLREFI